MLTHETFSSHLDSLKARGKASTARTVGIVLRTLGQVLDTRQTTALTATTADIEAWVLTLGDLAITTRASRIHTVRGFYQWLQQRGLRADDPSEPIRPARVRRRTVAKDHLSQQEAMALLETAAELAQEADAGMPRAVAHRLLAMVALGIATGRRRSGLCQALLTDLDLERQELRVAREKGQAGRVLPVAEWACEILTRYLAEARPVLLRRRRLPALFPGERSDFIGAATFAHALPPLHQQTCQRNPDLTDLPAKNLCPHALRVTFASVLFEGGCNLRSLNELMLHQKLSTTAQYTPVPVDTLRRMMVAAHPRAG